MWLNNRVMGARGPLFGWPVICFSIFPILFATPPLAVVRGTGGPGCGQFDIFRPAWDIIRVQCMKRRGRRDAVVITAAHHLIENKWDILPQRVQFEKTLKESFKI